MRALIHKEFTFSKHRTSLLGAFVWAGLQKQQVCGQKTFKACAHTSRKQNIHAPMKEAMHPLRVVLSQQ